MKALNPEHARRVIALINASPYFRHLGMRVMELGIGSSLVTLALDRRHHNPFGGVHGGVYSSLIDTAAYWALYGDIPEETGMISIDLSVNNLHPAREGGLIVRGLRLKAGKTICLAEAAVYDDRERMLAHGCSKMMVTGGIQTIGQAQALMEGGMLPPKFLDADESVHGGGL